VWEGNWVKIPVVPASAPGPIATALNFATRWSNSQDNHKRLWSWVPAFAGTTI
jgi:hypothetical protein